MYNVHDDKPDHLNKVLQEITDGTVNSPTTDATIKCNDALMDRYND